MGFHHISIRTINPRKWVTGWQIRSVEGKGIMTRCCRVLIDYAFDKLEMNRFKIHCNVENVRSRAIPERLGFKLEGIHRQVECRNNSFDDWAIYAMLKEDWRK